MASVRSKGDQVLSMNRLGHVCMLDMLANSIDPVSGPALLDPYRQAVALAQLARVEKSKCLKASFRFNSHTRTLCSVETQYCSRNSTTRTAKDHSQAHSFQRLLARSTTCNMELQALHCAACYIVILDGQGVKDLKDAAHALPLLPLFVADHDAFTIVEYPAILLLPV